MLKLIIKLGELYYTEVSTLDKVAEKDVVLTLLNDDCEEKPVFKREHMIHLQITGIYGVTEGTFSASQKRWCGKGDICYTAKKKHTYAGRDVGDTYFSKMVVNVENNTFNGIGCLPFSRPTADQKLVPMNRENRTVIG